VNNFETVKKYPRFIIFDMRDENKSETEYIYI
jgi:hypothetical protein